MTALVIGLGIPAMIALMIAGAAGIVKLARILCAAAVGFVRHEMMMRPQNVYFIGR